MTKDVIELAREAGFFLYDLTETHGIKTVESDAADQWAQLAHFAALVAAQVKERCAQLCESEWSNIAEKMYGAQLATLSAPSIPKGKEMTPLRRRKGNQNEHTTNHQI